MDNELLDIEEKLYFYPKQGEELFNNLLHNYQKKELSTYTGQIYFLLGLLAYEKADTDSSIVYLEKAIINFVKEDNKLYEAKSQLILGWISEKIGYWEQAKINYYKVIELVDENHTRELGMGYLGVARCKMYLKESFKYEMDKGSELIKSLNQREYTIYANYMMSMLDFSNQHTENRLKNTAKEYLLIGLQTNAAGVYKSLAKYYRTKRKLDSALYYIDKAIPLSVSDYPATSMTPALYQHKGYTLLLKGEYKKARHFLKESLKLHDDYKQPYAKQYAYETLCRIDTLSGDYKSGLYNLSMARKNEKINLNRSKQYLSRMMEVSAVLKLHKDEAIRLKTQSREILLLAIVIVLFIIILWILNYNKSKQRIFQEKTEKFELQNLIANIGEIQLLKKHYKLPKNEKNEFRTLDQQFEIGYAESIKIFRKKYKELTDNDIRYAVMFAMNISDNVIAKIRNISPDSVQRIKRKIRTKLNLEKGHDLCEYLKPFLK